MSWLHVWVVLVLVACGARQPVPVSREALAAADAELLAGCYDCLLAARASYRRLSGSAERPELLARVFEADLLIALRENELVLPPSDALADARRLARELPPAVEADRYLALVEVIPPDELGVSERARQASLTAFTTSVSRLGAMRRWLAGGALRKPVRDYLALALDCAFPLPAPLRERGTSPAPTDRTHDAPLLAYRAASCDPAGSPALVAVRTREPRFIEAAFAVAKREVDDAALGAPEHAREHLAELVAKFPRSPAISYLAGSYHQLLGEWAEALALHDRTLSAQPAHDRAQLGRTISLTNLARPREALEAATQLIALGGDGQVDGYYWRAWNHHTLAELADARADIDAAKALRGAPHVLSLAGIIEHDQGELELAKSDLEVAIAALDGDCTARWYLGLVHRKQKRWADSGHVFEAAMACFRDRAAGLGRRSAALEARSDLDPAYRERAIASLRASIDADVRQQHQAALVAAAGHAASGDLATARTLLELAAEEPALAEEVARLRAALDKPRPAPRR